MQKFSDILATMAPIDHLSKLELLDDTGNTVATIENKQGSQGSLKLYHHLWKKYGCINIAAAKEGLELYAEHTADAEANPGKHPNIDRLFKLISQQRELTVKAS